MVESEPTKNKQRTLAEAWGGYMSDGGKETSALVGALTKSVSCFVTEERCERKEKESMRVHLEWKMTPDDQEGGEWPSLYFAGKIRRKNRDGTFDIDYDDGAKEMGVPQKFIRLVDAGGNGSSGAG